MGRSSDFGPEWVDGSLELRVRAPGAEAVEAVFYDREDTAEVRGRLALTPSPARPGDPPGTAWSARGAPPGSGYSLRVRREGRWGPHLLDPYASSVRPGPSGTWRACVPAVDPGGDPVPPPLADRRPYPETVLYEAHVLRDTARHPEIPEELRGTYRGLSSPPMLEHFLRLGISAIEIMPVQQFVTEERLRSLGLSNVWGYNPVAWMSPHRGYARVDPLAEFRTMVGEFHEAGLEVWLDVVFNHTAEGGADGPTLSLRGLDPGGYYAFDPDGRPLDWTGCGNTVAAWKPESRHLIRDALRFWVERMGVDGFRFDLAPVLTRAATGEGREPFDPSGGLLAELSNRPEFSGIRWVGEPWDLGPKGYRLGGLPADWSEWNDRFRDAVRGAPSGRTSIAELRECVAGSPRTFGRKTHGAAASVHFVTAHDGFTLRDLTSYSRKHNLANGEDNRDGGDHEAPDGWGAEGDTDSRSIRALRGRVRRFLLTVLYLSRGVPMLSGGDEIGRTQYGNNNAYCQEGPEWWTPWDAVDPDLDLRPFLSRLAELRSRIPGLRTGAFGDPEDLPIVPERYPKLHTVGIAPGWWMFLNAGAEDYPIRGASVQRAVFDSADPLGHPPGPSPDGGPGIVRARSVLVCSASSATDEAS